MSMYEQDANIKDQKMAEEIKIILSTETGETEDIQIISSGREITENKVTPRPSGESASLKWLVPIDMLSIHRELEDPPGSSRAWDTAKKYKISDASGQHVFTCVEESDNFERFRLGNFRPWMIPVQDRDMKEVFRISRPFNRGWQRITVDSEGHVLGTVKQEFKCFGTLLTAYDRENNKVLKIQRKCCPCVCCCKGANVHFQLQYADSSNQIGSIEKEWTGCMRECQSNGNLFSIEFPVKLDVRYKALLIGAVILLDFLYWTPQTRHYYN